MFLMVSTAITAFTVNWLACVLHVVSYIWLVSYFNASRIKIIIATENRVQFNFPL